MITKEQETIRAYAHDVARGEDITVLDQETAQKITALLIAWKVEFAVRFVHDVWYIREV